MKMYYHNSLWHGGGNHSFSCSGVWISKADSLLTVHLIIQIFEIDNHFEPIWKEFVLFFCLVSDSDLAILLAEGSSEESVELPAGNVSLVCFSEPRVES